jgi:AsmA protein
MAKPLKIIGVIVGTIIILIAAILVYIALFFDPNAYKPQISEAVHDATGRQLTIQGDIGLSLFPWIGMELGQVTLSNAAGFDDKPFASINGAEVKLRLLPLLKQEVEMKAVILRGLRLNLEVAKDGTSNWADLGQTGADTTGQVPPPAPKSAPAKAAPAPAKPGGIGLAALAIGGVEVTDAQVSYDDRSTDSRYSAQQLNLITGPVTLTQPIKVSLNSHFSSNQPEVSGTLELKGRVVADMKQFQQHKLENMQLTLNFDSPAFDSRGKLTLNGELTADLEREIYRLDKLQLDSDIQNAALPNGRVAAKLSADVYADLKQPLATVSNLKLNAYDLNLTGQFKAGQILGTSPEISGDLALAPFNVRKLLQNLGQAVPNTADPETLKRASLELHFSGSPSKMNIEPLDLQLDDSTLDGSIHVAMAADKPLPALRYDLHLDAIDADRYLPPPAKGEQTKVAPPTAGAAAAGALPMELLRQLDINGNMDLAKLKVSGLHISQIKTHLSASNGLIRLKPEAQLYQGSYSGSAQLDARGETPKYTLDDKLTGIQAEPLIKDLMDKDLISGTGNIRSKLTTAGQTPDEMTKALNGRIDLSFTDGQIKGINLAQLLREAKAKLKKQPPPPKDEVKGTDFTELTATLKIRNGVVYNDNLSTKAPFVRIEGKGKADLVNQQLDYLVTAAIVKSATGAGGAELEELRGLPIPVRITGSFTAPDINLQYDEILKAQAKKVLAREKQKLREKAAAEKAKAQQRLEAEKEAARKKLEAEKEAARKKLEQKKEEELQKEKEKLKDKLKGLFK